MYLHSFITLVIIPMIYWLFDISEFKKTQPRNFIQPLDRWMPISCYCILQISAKYKLQGPNVLIICLWNASFFNIYGFLGLFLTLFSMSIDKRNGSAKENGQNIPLPDEPTMRLHCLACEPQHTCNRKKNRWQII